MTELSRATIRRLVYERAHGCCEYCQSCEDNTGQPMHIEHIDPAGGNNPDNLCLACVNCNLSKAAAITAIDPETSQIQSLFNPRTQEWAEHFVWTASSLYVQGLTPIGRATVQRLKMNRDRVIRARRRWLESGSHPPALSSD